MRYCSGRGRCRTSSIRLRRALLTSRRRSRRARERPRRLHRGPLRGGGERAPQVDEERFEREPGLDVELLQRPPGLADELGGAFGAGRALGCRVLAKLIEVVAVDGRVLGPGCDHGQVAVPSGELLEHQKELLPFGAALGSPYALLPLTRGEVEVLELGLSRGPSVCARLAGRTGNESRRARRAELRVAVNRATDCEESNPALRG